MAVVLTCHKPRRQKVLNPSDWAFDHITMGGVTFVSFATARVPYRFPNSQEERYIRDYYLGDASELVEHVFEVRSFTIANELKRSGFVSGSKIAKSLLQYLESEGYLNPSSEIDD